MKENKNVPKLRFPEFTGEWEQRTCNEILRPVKGAMKIGPFGSALKKEFYTESGVKVYAQENIFQEDFSIGNYYISDERYQSLKGCKLEPGDLVISMMGTIGACAIFPEKAEPGIMNSHLLRLQLKEDVYPEYIHQLLRDSQSIRNQIERLSVGSIMSGLSSSVVQRIVFPIPSVHEQKKIADILTNFDTLITLQQRKLDQIKEYKKGMLQKMFPKDGAAVPEVRFPGFSGEWERRKLGDISARYKNSIVDGPFGSDLKTIDYAKTGILVMQSNYITNGIFDIKQPYYVSYKKAEQLARCHCKGGDILVAKIGANFGICNIIPPIISDAVLSSNCLKVDLDEEHDNYFYMQYLNTLYSSGYYYSLVGITAQPALSLKFMKALEVPSPSLDEQLKISEFLTNLDALITLHQRKLDAMKEYKKGLLQQMFV